MQHIGGLSVRMRCVPETVQFSATNDDDILFNAW
jgi:hypothetical protein